MRFHLLAVGLLALAALAFTVAPAFAARYAGPVILVDLSHGENTRGLCTLFATVPEAYWIVLVPSEDYKLPECPIKPYEVWVGDFKKVSDKLMKTVDMIIIGQPTKYLSDEEIKVLVDWFKATKGRVLWCAGDSDYPAQGGNQEIANHACNALLEELGVSLRLDYVSVEDPVSCAGKPYRVVGKVAPDNKYGAEMVAFGADKVLFHGPGAVAWVDSSGVWHKLTEPGTPENIVKLVVTTENGRIVEHQPKAPGAPGEFGKAHKVGEKGVFVLMAAEIVGDKELPSVVIVSGESPYGGYQPMVTYRYHGVPLSGPRFVRNVILWALHYPAELAAYEKLAVPAKAAAAPSAKEVEEVKSKVASLESKVADLESKISKTVDKVNEAISTVNKVTDAVNKLQSDVQAVLGTLQTVSYAAIALAVVAIIVAILPLVLKRK